METKDFEGHTPGPWHVGERKARGWSDQADYFVYVGEDAGEPSLICRPYATDGYDGIAERNANAALIAAAPRLLSVQKQLVEALEASEFILSMIVQHGQYKPLDVSAVKELHDSARAAILAARASS